MDIPGEYISEVGYLVHSSRLSDTRRKLCARTSWIPGQIFRLTSAKVLIPFARPEGAAREDAPSNQPDSMIVIVSPARYRQHKADYTAAGWSVGSDDHASDGYRAVAWNSPRLARALAAVRAQAEERAVAQYYSERRYPSYARTSRPGNGSTLGSGMRTGAFAAFVDGVTDGGFFDF